jgi:hypothetical protein
MIRVRRRTTGRGEEKESWVIREDIRSVLVWNELMWSKVRMYVISLGAQSRTNHQG